MDVDVEDPGHLPSPGQQRLQRQAQPPPTAAVSCPVTLTSLRWTLNWIRTCCILTFIFNCTCIGSLFVLLQALVWKSPDFAVVLSCIAIIKVIEGFWSGGLGDEKEVDQVGVLEKHVHRFSSGKNDPTSPTPPRENPLEVRVRAKRGECKHLGNGGQCPPVGVR